ncbi:tetratricopeptide repeat protein [Streptomyces sp. NPDC086783]|uniref:tetratricopeptide repeat protein n=1 Tax=Streptomyces sp. NPDC086783 TaxID=3365758 RepID=UPI003802203D
MEFIRMRGVRWWPRRDAKGFSDSQAAALKELLSLVKADRYEEVEVRARALATTPHRNGGRDAMTVWLARTFAASAAVLHGRGEEVLPELDALSAELAHTSGTDRTVLLVNRVSRATVLIRLERYTEAEAEVSDVLRAVTRLAHLTDVWDVELSALSCLAEVLCALGRYEEAEAVARGNLPRAKGSRATSLRCLLAQSLNGQGRYEEALAECRAPTAPVSRAGTGYLDMVTAAALHGLGHRGEAETAARQALDDCERLLHPSHPRIGKIRALLADITAEEPPGEGSN